MSRGPGENPGGKSPVGTKVLNIAKKPNPKWEAQQQKALEAKQQREDAQRAEAEKRQAQQKVAAEVLAAQQREEAERLAAQQKVEAERLAAEKLAAEQEAAEKAALGSLAPNENDDFGLATDKETVLKEAPALAERFPTASGGVNAAKQRAQAAKYEGPLKTQDLEIEALATALTAAKEAADEAANHPELSEQIEAAMKAVGEALGTGKYEAARAEAKRLAEAANAAKEEKKRIAARKLDVSAEYAKSKEQIAALTPDASQDQIARLTGHEKNIDVSLGAATATDPTLDAAASDIGKLNLEIDAVRKEIEQEQRRLAEERERLLGSLEKKAVPGGATGEEEEVIENLRTGVADALPAPSKQSDIEGAIKLIDVLDAKIDEISKAIRKRLEERKTALTVDLKAAKDPQGCDKAQEERLAEARRAVQKSLSQKGLTEEILDEVDRQLALLYDAIAQVGEDIDASFTLVTTKKRVVKTPEEREAARQVAITAKAAEVISQAIAVAGTFPRSKTPGREDCVSHGPGIEVEKNIAADVKAIILAREGERVNSDVGPLYIHFVPKGGKAYDVTLHRTYCPRFNPRVSPGTQTIMHVTVGS